MTVRLQGIYNKQEAKAVKELKTGGRYHVELRIYKHRG